MKELNFDVLKDFLVIRKRYPLMNDSKLKKSHHLLIEKIYGLEYLIVDSMVLKIKNEIFISSFLTKNKSVGKIKDIIFLFYKYIKKYPNIIFVDKNYLILFINSEFIFFKEVNQKNKLEIINFIKFCKYHVNNINHFYYLDLGKEELLLKEIEEYFNIVKIKC